MYTYILQYTDTSFSMYRNIVFYIVNADYNNIYYNSAILYAMFMSCYVHLQYGILY